MSRNNTPAPRPPQPRLDGRGETRSRDLERCRPARPGPGPNTEAYDKIVDNPFHMTTAEPLSTFSIDVDTASYANVRRFLGQNMLPPKDAVRIEEMLNYFAYDDAPPLQRASIPSPSMSRSRAAPGTPSTGWRGSACRRPIDHGGGPPATSSSWSTSPARWQSPTSSPWSSGASSGWSSNLARTIRSPSSSTRGRRVWCCPPTSCRTRRRSSRPSTSSAGGSTNGAAGIQLAYDIATQNFIKKGTNRVILATDGDFNVGVSTGRPHPTDRGQGQKRRVPQRARLSAWATSRTTRSRSSPTRATATTPTSTRPREAYKVLVDGDGLDAGHRRQGREDPGRVQPAKVGAFRLIGYENRSWPTRISTTTPRTPANRRGPPCHGALRARPDRQGRGSPGIDPLKYTEARRLDRVRATSRSPSSSATNAPTATPAA